MYYVCAFLEWVDGMLDCVPSFEDGHWYRYGQWGCRMRMQRFWDRGYQEEEK